METINNRISEIVSKSNLSKTAFAEKINVSQQYVSKLTKDGVPSDRTISDICNKFNVQEKWLRTGEGEMFMKLSRDEELSAFMGTVLTGDSGFKRRLIAVLSRMSDDEWCLLERKISELVDEMKNNE